MLYIVLIPCVRHVFVVYNSNLLYSLTNIGVYVVLFCSIFFRTCPAEDETCRGMDITK